METTTAVSLHIENEQFDNVAELQEATKEYLKGNYETAFNKFCELAGE